MNRKQPFTSEEKEKTFIPIRPPLPSTSAYDKTIKEKRMTPAEHKTRIEKVTVVCVWCTTILGECSASNAEYFVSVDFKTADLSADNGV